MLTKSWIGCWWQFDGQWWRISDQERAEPGSVPSSGSVAMPLKLTVSPTFQFRELEGDRIVAAGGALAFALIVTSSVSEAPWLSVTRRRAV